MEQNIKQYKIFTASPIWLSILHLISILFFQTNFNISINNDYSGYGSFGFLFGSSQFFFSIINSSLNAIKVSVSISTIVIALGLVFSSYFSLTKNQKFIYLSLGLYILDYVLSITGQIIASFNEIISLNFISYFFANFIHIIGILLIIYSLYISSKIREE